MISKADIKDESKDASALTLSLWDVSGVDAQRHFALLQVRLFWDLVLLVEFIQHFHAAIFEDLLRAVGVEAELEDIGLLLGPLNNVLALIIVVE